MVEYKKVKNWQQVTMAGQVGMDEPDMLIEAHSMPRPLSRSTQSAAINPDLLVREV